MRNNVAVIILAAGMGTRMKSAKAKVLHEVQGRPMVLYVVEAAREVVGNDVVVVVGNQAQKVREVVLQLADIYFAHQEKQLGTAHAVLCALPHLPDHCEHVVILCGDVPLIESETIDGLITDHLNNRRDISLLAVELDDPFGYGRVLLNDRRQVSAIVEEADADAEQKKIKLINSGIYCVDKQVLLDALPKIRTNNAQGELYLTDIMAIGYAEKKKMGVMIGNNYQQILGINTTQDLITVDRIMRRRLCNP